jgi:hypothetical protein
MGFRRKIGDLAGFSLTKRPPQKIGAGIPLSRLPRGRGFAKPLKKRKTEIAKNCEVGRFADFASDLVRPSAKLLISQQKRSD